MAKRKLLDYFGLMELDNTKFANRFFNVIKSSNSKIRDFSPYLNYAKFISSISLLTKGDRKDRLKFIYSIFDLDEDKYIEREEMLNIFMSFFEAMNRVHFQAPDLDLLKTKINEAHEKHIKEALESIVDDIYTKHSHKPDILFYDEWQEWFLTLEGMTEVLDYKVDNFEA